MTFHRRKFVLITLMCFLLSACVSNLIFGSKVQSKMMWALLKPLVGFDPTQVNLFENPLIKDRMTALLGDKYEPTMRLLKTANDIQQEGALFYVMSRYAPEPVKGVTDKAAMVWNADTNQMAVMLIKDGTPEILSEQIQGAKQAIVPVLPKEIQQAYEHAQAAKKAYDDAQKKLLDTQKSLEDLTSGKSVEDALKQKATENLPPLENIPLEPMPKAKPE